MVAELISVGTEILLGNIVNTNAAYLSEQCAALGLSCYYQSVVGDNESRLAKTLELALLRSDIVILSGGLGPTKDDLTKEVVAKVLHRELAMDIRSKSRLEDYFQVRKIKMTENNWKQAMIPVDSIAVDNENGTAPGIIIEDGKKHIILLPGPPNELIPMFERSIAPYLEKCELGMIVSRTVKLCGIGESLAETMISDLIDEQTNPTIAPYAKTGEVHLRITARAEDEKSAKKLIKPMVRELKKRFGDHVYTTKVEDNLETVIIKKLYKLGLSIATAESCTGGMVAARIVGVPGASSVYGAGFITYSNKAKRKYLGVKKLTLEKYGAVSEQVASQMAKGACENGESDVSLAITGIAGPGGGTEQKPVGLVYIACTVCGITAVKEYLFKGERMKIRESATAAALTLLREELLAYEEV